MDCLGEHGNCPLARLLPHALSDQPSEIRCRKRHPGFPEYVQCFAAPGALGKTGGILSCVTLGVGRRLNRASMWLTSAPECAMRWVQ
jgi:hypothetical protein